jgi:hypothetical protein
MELPWLPASLGGQDNIEELKRHGTVQPDIPKDPKCVHCGLRLLTSEIKSGICGMCEYTS